MNQCPSCGVELTRETTGPTFAAIRCNNCSATLVYSDLLRLTRDRVAFALGGAPTVTIFMIAGANAIVSALFGFVAGYVLSKIVVRNIPKHRWIVKKQGNIPPQALQSEPHTIDNIAYAQDLFGRIGQTKTSSFVLVLFFSLLTIFFVTAGTVASYEILQNKNPLKNTSALGELLFFILACIGVPAALWLVYLRDKYPKKFDNSRIVRRVKTILRHSGPGGLGK